MNKLGIIFISLTLLFLVAFIGVRIYDEDNNSEIERQRVLDEYKLLLDDRTRLLQERNKILQQILDLKTGKLKSA